jgi:3,4-dihydroxy-9,10-secoandrosta-1,3,5(10)-triene-9,17-dione 4,5-dioxygenase
VTLRSLGYVHWHARDVEAWARFAGEVLGLMVVDVEGADGRGLAIRWDERDFRLLVRGGDEPRIGALGFQARDERDLAEVALAVAASGRKVEDLGPDDCAERRVNAAVRFQDPDGTPIEVFWGPVLSHVPVQTPLVSGFVTGELGMGHAVIATDDLSASSVFYRDVLGLTLRNTMTFRPPPPAPGAPMSFFGCNPRHHSLGVLQYPVPGRLLHVMVEANTIDDVGFALDRCLDAGVPISQGLGRHSNDHMLSFYAVGPDGVQIEFGWGGLYVGPDDDAVYEITKTSFWGHRPLKP